MKFEDRLKQYIDDTGGTLAQGISKIARMYPGAHEDYLKRLKAGEAQSLSMNPLLKARRGDFEQKVKDIMYKYNVTDQSKAMMMAKSHHPREYAEFVARVEKEKKLAVKVSSPEPVQRRLSRSVKMKMGE